MRQASRFEIPGNQLARRPYGDTAEASVLPISGAGRKTAFDSHVELLDDMADLLDKSGRYRILRRLEPRAAYSV
ncbi:hypothetical protein ABTO49_21085, partial [Acinetobacter baumannii]